jgi:hypothetical protein
MSLDPNPAILVYILDLKGTCIYVLLYRLSWLHIGPVHAIERKCKHLPMSSRFEMVAHR